MAMMTPFTTIVLSTVLVMANTSRASDLGGACGHISRTCTDAGFIRGQGGEGRELFPDCIYPIISGSPAAKGFDTVTLLSQRWPTLGHRATVKLVLIHPALRVRDGSRFDEVFLIAVG